MKVVISPHDDDAVLFASFTCLREHPVMVVVFDGHVQAARGFNVTAEERAKETALAADILECSRVVRLGFSDEMPLPPAPLEIWRALKAALPMADVERWYLPAVEMDGHEQHNVVGQVERYVEPVTRYLTYTREGGKSTHGRRVEIEHGEWIASKLQALSVYKSQMIEARLGCRPHFLRSQEEYYL